MRKNLDPFSEHSDADLWNALEEVCGNCKFTETRNQVFAKGAFSPSPLVFNELKFEVQRN